LHVTRQQDCASEWWNRHAVFNDFVTSLICRVGNGVTSGTVNVERRPKPKPGSRRPTVDCDIGVALDLRLDRQIPPSCRNSAYSKGCGGDHQHRAGGTAIFSAFMSNLPNVESGCRRCNHPRDDRANCFEFAIAGCVKNNPKGAAANL